MAAIWAGLIVPTSPLDVGFLWLTAAEVEYFNILASFPGRVAPVRDTRMGTSNPHSTFVASKMGL